MGDQQQTPLHKWEIVSQGDRGENATTYRMRVPGGWLYRYQAAEERHIGRACVCWDLGDGVSGRFLAAFAAAEGLSGAPRDAGDRLILW
jgi:hypothetical protein